jgi:hypothetical protein
MKKNLINLPTFACASLLLVAVILCGCDKGEKHPPVICSKSYSTYGGSDMPKGLCRYFYSEYDSFYEWTEFTDSCGKYNVSDTLVGRKNNCH